MTKNKTVGNKEAGVRDRSLARLALTVIISPKDAFDEILRRNLLIPGILITAAIGAISTAVVVYGFYHHNAGSLYDLGMGNPISHAGLLVVSAWVAYMLARRMEGKGSYLGTLTVLAWVNIIALIETVLRFVSSDVFASLIALIGFIWIAIVSAIGIRQAHGFSVWKGVGAYLFSLLAVEMLFFEAPRYFLKAFYPELAMTFPSYAAFAIPGQVVTSWLAAAALVAAAVTLPRLAAGGIRRLQPVLIAFAASGVIIAVVIAGYLQKVDPIREVVRGVAAYRSEEPDPARAAAHFRRDLQYLPSDSYVQLYLAHSLAAAGDYEEAVRAYEKARKMNWPFAPFQAFNSACFTGIGTVRYFEGKYAAARDEFDSGSHGGGMEPKARLGLAYLRLGKPKDAIEAANSAVKVGNKGYLPQVVLAQAYTITGDAKKAQEAIRAVEKIDKRLARRLASGSGGWSRAVEGLTRLDLRMPLELAKLAQPGSGAPSD